MTGNDQAIAAGIASHTYRHRNSPVGRTLYLHTLVLYRDPMQGIEGGFMDATIEKRACDRFSCDFSVVWCYFNQNRFHKATQVNCSEGGLCLESSIAPHAGATILIKRRYPTTGTSTGIIPEGHREMTLAEVRWCCEAEDAVDGLYRVGVSYLCDGYP